MKIGAECRLADRSMQSMSADAPARAEVSKAWDGFKEKKDGADAVANARSQNAFKFAEQSGASINYGAAESLRGFALNAPSAPAESDRLTQYTRQSKVRERPRVFPKWQAMD
jgi:hypothetical protein